MIFYNSKIIIEVHSVKPVNIKLRYDIKTKRNKLFCIGYLNQTLNIMKKMSSKNSFPKSLALTKDYFLTENS